MRRMARLLLFAGLALTVWGCWLVTEMARTTTEIAAVLAEVNMRQDASQAAIRQQLATQAMIAREQARLRDEREWTIKRYTCIDDGKTPQDPTYCITKDGTKLTASHLHPHSRIVAVKPGRLPLGTTVEIDGVGTARVADWGDLQEDEIDLWIGEDNQEAARQIGIEKRKVRVME